MSEWLIKAFSGGVSLSRINPAGAGLMLLAVAMLVCVRGIALRCAKEQQERVCAAIKLSGLLICALGAAISFL